MLHECIVLACLKSLTFYPSYFLMREVCWPLLRSAVDALNRADRVMVQQLQDQSERERV